MAVFVFFIDFQRTAKESSCNRLNMTLQNSIWLVYIEYIVKNWNASMFATIIIWTQSTYKTCNEVIITEYIPKDTVRVRERGKGVSARTSGNIKQAVLFVERCAVFISINSDFILPSCKNFSYSTFTVSSASNYCVYTFFLMFVVCCFLQHCKYLVRNVLLEVLSREFGEIDKQCCFCYYVRYVLYSSSSVYFLFHSVSTEIMAIRLEFTSKCVYHILYKLTTKLQQDKAP